MPDKSNFNYKKSSASSVAGTIGSTITNYSDSEAGSSYYRSGSHVSSSTSSLAPSVASQASSSLPVSSSSSVVSSRNSNSGSYDQSNHKTYKNRAHHHRAGGSMGSSTDLSSLYSSNRSYKDDDSSYSVPANNTSTGRSYHPYRR